MGDWSFAIFDELLFLIVAIVGLLLCMFLMKGRSVRRIIKIAIVTVILYTVYAIVAHKLAQDERDRNREGRLEKVA